MDNFFIFNGIKSSAIGLVVNGVNIYGSASRVVEKIQVPYRNGDLLIDTGAFNNYLLTYEVSLLDNVQINARALSQWLLGAKGYKELTDTYTTDIKRVAAYYNQLDITLSRLNRYGKATITFDCKPQKYLLTGDTAIVIPAGTTTINAEYFSEPSLNVLSNATITWNGKTIKVNDAPTVIDSQRQQCFRGTANKNNTVEMEDFPLLELGENTIETDVSFTLRPRWWVI